MTPTLPTAAEDWPLSLHAACAQLLHRAHIPADLFGDLLNAHYGSPQVVLVSLKHILFFLDMLSLWLYNTTDSISPLCKQDLWLRRACPSIRTSHRSHL